MVKGNRRSSFTMGGWSAHVSQPHPQVRTDTDIQSGVSLRMSGAFGDGFQLLLIDPADRDLDIPTIADKQSLRLPYLNSPAAHDALRRFMSEALIHKWLFGFFVMRAPRDPASWLVETQQTGRPQILPMAVEPLDPLRGQLYVCRDEFGDSYMAYEAKDPALNRKFRYSVYVRPDLPFPEPLTRRQFLTTYPVIYRAIRREMNCDPLDSSIADSFLFGVAGADEDRAPRIVASLFWRLKQLQMERDELDVGLLDGTHVLTYPRPVFGMRPASEIKPQRVGQEYYQRYESLMEAARANKNEAEKIGYLDAMHDMGRFMIDPVSHITMGADGRPEQTKKKSLRAMSDRPDPVEDFELLREDVQLMQQAVPTLQPDVAADWRVRFQLTVCQVLGGIPLLDVQMGRSGSGGTHEAQLRQAQQQQQQGLLGGGKSTKEQAQSNESDLARNALFRQTRAEMNSLLAWAYPETLGLFDLALLNESMESLTDQARRRLASVSGGRDASRRQRRQMLFDALPGQGRKAKKRKAAELDAPAAETPTTAELRAIIQERMADREPFEAILVFDADVKAAATKALIDDHEHLPPELMEQRRATGEMLGKMADGHQIGFGSVQGYLKEKMGLDVEAPPAEEFNLLKPPPGKKAKK